MSRDGYRQCLFNHLLLRQILIEFHNFPRYDIGFLSIFKKNNFGSWSPKANILVAEVAERQKFAQKFFKTCMEHEARRQTGFDASGFENH